MNARSVSFIDCERQLVTRGGAPAISALRAWEARADRSEVVPFVKAFTHEVLFAITSHDIRRVRDGTHHALGNIHKSRQIYEIEQFTAPFAVQHIFHDYLEKKGSVPTWQAFKTHLRTEARHQWLDHLEPLRRQLALTYDPARISDAIQWRLGKLYYSALRETDFLASMSRRGIKLNYHLLADVLLASDFWWHDTILSLRVSNVYERRKQHARTYLNEATPPFKFIDCVVEQQRFGYVWLISSRSKDEVAKSLLSAISEGG